MDQVRSKRIPCSSIKKALYKLIGNYYLEFQRTGDDLPIKGTF